MYVIDMKYSFFTKDTVAVPVSDTICSSCNFKKLITYDTQLNKKVGMISELRPKWYHNKQLQIALTAVA
jgi:hypothetical protein